MTVIKDTKTGIKVALEQLEKEEWLGMIEVLIDNFRGYPFDNADMQSPKAMILTLLESLQGEEKTDGNLLITLFISRISSADMFSYRAFRSTKNGAVYWNSLEERYRDFASIGDVTKYQSESEYPASDIIGNWCHYQIRTTNR